MNPSVSVLFLVPLAGAAAPQSSSVLVSGYNSDTVHRVDPQTGAFLGTLGSIPGAQSLRYGPDGHLYACSEKTNRVLQLDGQSGALLGELVADDPLTPGDETGGLNTPTAAVFGPDGNLYVASFNGDRILRYDGQTGAFLDVFVPTGSGGLNGPDAGMVFGPDGDLYVPSFNNNRILRYDGQTGAFLGAFVGAGVGGLANPRALRFRGDGWLYVTSWGNSRVKRYDASGQFVDNFVTTFRPTGLAFVPGSGDLLVTNDQNNAVRRYSGVDGSLVSTLVLPNNGVLLGGTYLEYLPDPELRLDRPQPGVAGQSNTVAIRGATPDGALVLGVGTQPTSLFLELCAPVYLGILDFVPVLLVADAAGEASLTAPVGAGLAGATLLFQAYDPQDCRMSNRVDQVF